MDTHAFEGTGPVAPAHAFDVERVSRWLESAIPGFAGPVQVSQFKGGQSNPTFLLQTPSQRYVLRRKPGGPTLKTAHAVDREFRITSALHSHGVPVARPLAFCDDREVMETPFFVMECVEGRIFWDPSLPGLQPAERHQLFRSLAETLAGLHKVPVQQAGLDDFGRPGDYFQRQITRWSQQYLAAKTREIPAMDTLMRRLQEQPPAGSGRQCVIHGDFRLDNVIFDSATLDVRAVIDWELSTLGDPLADLSYQCMLWHLPPGAFGSLAGVDVATAGIPTERQYIDTYLSAAGGVIPADWSVCLAFNMFRLAAILEGVARRAIEGNASSRRAHDMAQLVEPIAERACTLLG